MNFSKLKLNESVAKGDYTGLSAQQATGAKALASSQEKFHRNNDVKAAKTKLASQPVGTKQSQQTVMSSHTPDVDKYFAEMRAEVERIKTIQAQQSNWRSELQEKAVDGVEREGHPFVTVMPTGDEALIQAMKQMGGEAQEKKKKLQSAGVEVNMQKEETEEVETIDEKINPLLKGILKKTPKGEDPKKGGVPYKITGKMTEEMEELEEKKKKGCKDGYKRDENGNCVKKEKSKTVIVGRGWGYGGHHHHDHDESPDDDGGGGGDGDGGGGMGEMFDFLGDMLLKEKLESGKEYHARMKNQNSGPINPYAVPKKPKAEKPKMVNQTPKIKLTGDMTKATDPRPGSNYRGD